jgi:hypothetical protein
MKSHAHQRATPIQPVVTAARDLFARANWRCSEVQCSLTEIEIEHDGLAAGFEQVQKPPNITTQQEMKKNSYSLVRAFQSGVFALSMLTAVAATAGQTELARAIGDTKSEVIQTRNELQNTVDAIDALSKQKGGDMRPTYDTFVSQIGKTETAAAWTRNRLGRMLSEADNHFGTWQRDIDSISNSDLKKKAQKRLTSVKKSYNNVIKDMQEAAPRFQALLSDLSDIQKTLSNDLTQGGVKASRRSISDAQWNLKSARRSINDAIEELGRMEKSLDTTAGN